jgi:hypothetical protein
MSGPQQFARCAGPFGQSPSWPVFPSGAPRFDLWGRNGFDTAAWAKHASRDSQQTRKPRWQKQSTKSLSWVSTAQVVRPLWQPNSCQPFVGRCSLGQQERHSEQNPVSSAGNLAAGGHATGKPVSPQACKSWIVNAVVDVGSIPTGSTFFPTGQRARNNKSRYYYTRRPVAGAGGSPT